MNDAETFVRFMRHVEIPAEKGACWVWTGTKPDGRYGHFSLGGDAVKAHRWIYECVVAEIPADLIVRHKCDNPSCVNPMHLETGTYADNTRDKFERGRGADRKGEKHPLAKLTSDKVLEIRRLASCGTVHSVLAKQFGVRRGQIGKIVQRINWSHI